MNRNGAEIPMLTAEIDDDPLGRHDAPRPDLARQLPGKLW
jgi:hypothetical protein